MSEHDTRPLDLHELYRQQFEVGGAFQQGLCLHGHEAQTIAARLRGIEAISALLIASSGEDFTLGPWLLDGLAVAVNRLAADTLEDMNASWTARQGAES